ncbi:UDP-N-acetylglucosamine 2-epimerase (hydrolyzing) [Acetobacterium wieringae]|uniref:UDP-N-acetylglucosamine 2-epimerase (Hydrolyzing) n=1 Tax=Acetobacterium wieringae TaxID=52694 RepID=A0A5D0WPH7_9FIRM|nr:UDP-N-acetylglucosamine 2-epimerase [Acetobacterium wieringae]TYC85956.1 UDP-N-acetylglucosamine 2-epimerase (hydrolyzing) [Acetobacterium wieringae]
MKKVLAVTGIRSEYFILQPIFDEILERNDLKLKVVVTGTHLSPLYGDTYKLIEKDGYDIIKLESLLVTDNLSGRCKSLGIQLMGLVDIINQEEPDWLLVLGDREESLTVATAGAYMNIPVAHVCGGDRVVGNVDDSVRHAVTKLAHLHFPTTVENGERIIKMGEEEWRVNVTGNPALDSIRKQPNLTLEEINLEIGTDLKAGEPFILLINHPLSSEHNLAKEQMDIVLDSVAELEIQTIIIYPNSDAGSLGIIESIENHLNEYSLFHAFKTLPRDIFVNLQRKAALLLGNSSCGILEAPFLRLPVVNVGNRQKQRQHSENIIFVDCKKEMILDAIDKAINDDEFLKICKNCSNPYGDGYSGKKIAHIIAETEINSELINKQISY